MKGHSAPFQGIEVCTALRKEWKLLPHAADFIQVEGGKLYAFLFIHLVDDIAPTLSCSAAILSRDISLSFQGVFITFIIRVSLLL